MYNYKEEKQSVFTEEGFKMINKIKSNIKDLRYFDFYDMTKGLTGNSFKMLACIDCLEEFNEIECIKKSGSRQNWVYSKVN